MPDTRRTHIHYPPGPSLMNQPTPPFNGAATTLYGERGPQRSHNTGRQEPQSLADHVDAALDRVKGLGPQQKLSLHNEICRMLRDIEVIRLVAHSVRGPYGEAAVHQDEGRLL